MHFNTYKYEDKLMYLNKSHKKKKKHYLATAKFLQACPETSELSSCLFMLAVCVRSLPASSNFPLAMPFFEFLSMLDPIQEDIDLIFLPFHLLGQVKLF